MEKKKKTYVTMLLKNLEAKIYNKNAPKAREMPCTYADFTLQYTGPVVFCHHQPCKKQTNFIPVDT